MPEIKCHSGVNINAGVNYEKLYAAGYDDSVVPDDQLLYTFHLITILLISRNKDCVHSTDSAKVLWRTETINCNSRTKSAMAIAIVSVLVAPPLTENAE